MIQISLARRIVGWILGFWMALLAGCTPVYLWDTHTTATPRPQSFDVATPVATLGLLAPASLQGFTLFCPVPSLPRSRKRPHPCGEFPAMRR
jgi:hypothetical protein